MAFKILLVSVNRCDSPYLVYPLGLSHIAAALVKAGHEIYVADCAIDGRDLSEIVASFKPSHIGLSLRNIDDIQIKNPRFFAQDLSFIAQSLRKISDAPIIVGGSGYSLFPAELLEATSADFGIHGEGDVTFVKLLDAMEKNESYTALPGLVFRKNGSIVINPLAGMKTSDIVPAYRSERLAHWYIGKSSILNIQTQRGCSCSCCYCTYPVIEGHSVRSRNMDDVGNELCEIKNLGASYFFIVDSVFNSSPGHVRAFCEEVISSNLGMTWGCFLKPSGLTQELMDLMAKAGLRHIEFGSDSFCDSVLREYGKNFTFQDIYNASAYARNARVNYAHFLIIGGPGETEATMREGYENSKRLLKTVHFPFVGMRIYPNTDLHKRAVAENAVTKETDLLRPHFYLTPHCTEERMFSVLSEFSAQSKNWIVGEQPPEMIAVANRLREKGIVGPLWEFLVR